MTTAQPIVFARLLIVFTATSPVLARCWHKPSPPDCAGLRRLMPRTLADLRGLQRLVLAYARFRPPGGTANAVRVRALPGFKSPSLRGSRPPPWMLWGGGPIRGRPKQAGPRRESRQAPAGGIGAPRSRVPANPQGGPGRLWASQPGVRGPAGARGGRSQFSISWAMGRTTSAGGEWLDQALTRRRLVPELRSGIRQRSPNACGPADSGCLA
jgi:hypothetical protein